jgi:hypothetical protein
VVAVHRHVWTGLYLRDAWVGGGDLKCRSRPRKRSDTGIRCR